MELPFDKKPFSEAKNPGYQGIIQSLAHEKTQHLKTLRVWTVCVARSWDKDQTDISYYKTLYLQPYGIYIFLCLDPKTLISLSILGRFIFRNRLL